MSIIFTTLHGSRLYGFWGAGSDYDTFDVTDDRTARLKQVVTGSEDRTVVGIDYFLELAEGGSHQAVEALFSPVKRWPDPVLEQAWRPLLEGVRIGGGEVFAKYERTIRAFCYGDFKRRRHAVRLAFNLTALRKEGRLNPCCTWTQIQVCNRTAGAYAGDELARNLGVYRKETA